LLIGGFSVNGGFRPVNFVPFETIGRYVSARGWINSGIWIDNLVGNVMIFVPLGLLLGAFKRPKRVWTSLLIVLASTVAVETAQYVFCVGSCDVDDVILNFAGGAIGVVLYQIVLKMMKDTEKARMVAAVLLVILGAAFLAYTRR